MNAMLAMYVSSKPSSQLHAGNTFLYHSCSVVASRVLVS